MYPDVYILIGSSVRAEFIVFASVLIAKIVIEEYKNKTILLLFFILSVERKLSQVNGC
ncbi:ABC-type transport system involved in multi-copper enzyme maturation permease subunit [Lysinibacillus sp. TE18511]